MQEKLSNFRTAPYLGLLTMNYEVHNWLNLRKTLSNYKSFDILGSLKGLIGLLITHITIQKFYNYKDVSIYFRAEERKCKKMVL